jgi:hypothetical protein
MNLARIRMWVRCSWLAFCRDYKDATSVCYSCGRYGASVVSLVYPKRLCKACEQSFQRRYHASISIADAFEQSVARNHDLLQRMGDD